MQSSEFPGCGADRGARSECARRGRDPPRLPHARIVLDHFHLVMLGDAMVTDVRQRRAAGAARTARHEGRPGMRTRRLLLRGGDRLSPKALSRLQTVFTTDDRHRRDQRRLGLQGAAPSTPRSARPDPVQPARDCPPPDPVPHRLRDRRTCLRRHASRARSRGLARDRRLPRARRHERPDRGLQPRHQADQEGRLRVPERRRTANYERRIMLHSAALWAA